MNHVKTALLLAGLTALFVVAGRALGGQTGMVIAVGLAMVMNIGAYWFSDKIVLAMYHAQPVTPQQAPELYRMVERLCQRANLPMPKLYVIDEPTPNAFATGRDPGHAAVAVNQGLLNVLEQDEVEGVIAHELAHIKNRDTLISAIAATITGAIAGVADMAKWAMIFGGMHRDEDGEGANPIVMLVMMIVAPLIALVLQLAISRSREYQADRIGAEICGRPLSLADALRKLHATAERVPTHASPATAHMFIVNPLAGKSMLAWLSTHPPMEDRIARLEAMARELGQAVRAYA